MNTLLLTGHRKSGTTLLHRLFDGHPDCVVYPTDLGLLYAYLPCFAASKRSEKVLRRRIDHILTESLKDFDGLRLGPMTTKALDVGAFRRNLQESLSPDDLGDASALFGKVVAAFRLIVGADANALLVIKETSQAVYFEDLRQSVDGFRLLSIVRDPRDNFAAISEGVNNYYSRLGEGRPHALASFINRARMDLKAALHLPTESSATSSIKFEALVDNPTGVMRQLASWLSLEYSKELVQPSRVGQEFSGNNHGGKRFSGISKEHVGAWQHRIKSPEIGIIEHWLSDVMKAWNYPLSMSDSDALRHFADFYRWYNCEYFYFGTGFDL